MNNSVFKKNYANQYDQFYKEKNYQSECDLIEACLSKYSNGSAHTILDLGCGTGNHTIPMAKRGYRMTGVDLSDDMLSFAREKTITEMVTPEFIQNDIRTLNLNQQFDVVLMMFAVLGYQLTNEDVISSLKVVRKHLNLNGLFIFDVWYGPAVLSIRPGDRVKIIPTADGKIIRTASGGLDVSHHLSDVHFHIWSLSGNKVINESEEVHTMRFFFPMELDFMLSTCGLALESLTAFPSLEQPADETTWNVLGVARAV
jgi:SAM-dependent methyltransferase